MMSVTEQYETIDGDTPQSAAQPASVGLIEPISANQAPNRPMMAAAGGGGIGGGPVEFYNTGPRGGSSGGGISGGSRSYYQTPRAVAVSEDLLAMGNVAGATYATTIAMLGSADAFVQTVLTATRINNQNATLELTALATSINNLLYPGLAFGRGVGAQSAVAATAAARHDPYYPPGTPVVT
jgi:hypothetical protein